MNEDSGSDVEGKVAMLSLNSGYSSFDRGRFPHHSISLDEGRNGLEIWKRISDNMPPIDGSSEGSLLQRQDSSLNPSSPSSPSGNVRKRNSRKSNKTSQQYLALMHKNFILLRRQKMLTCCQFIIPLLLVMMMGGLSFFIQEATRDLIANNVNPNATVFLSPLQNEGDFLFFSTPAGQRTPPTLGQLTQNGNKSGMLGRIPQLEASDSDGYFPYFESRLNREVVVHELISEKERYMSEVSNGLTPDTQLPVACVTFNTFSPADASLDFEVITEQQVGYPTTTNFTSIQLATVQLITNAFLSYVTNGSFQIGVSMKAFPTSTHTNLIDASLLAGLFYPLALSFFLPIFVHSIVLEKQLGLCEMMHLMGMKKRHYWLVTYVYDMLLYCCVVALVLGFSVAFRIAWIMTGSVVIVLLLLFGWGNALIAFAFLLSTLFNKTRTATTITSFVVVISVIISLALSNAVFGTERSWPYLMLYPPFSFYRAISLLGFYCGVGDCPRLEDFRWEGEITQLCISLYVASIVMFILAGYLDNVMPRQWGVAKPPLFFLNPLKRLCCRSRYASSNGRTEDLSPLLTSQSTTKLDSEDATTERQRVFNKHYSSSCPVVVADLRKEYRDGKVAVNNLCLAVENGECFGLLGPNGAGKTTTISILTGSTPATSGMVRIAGFDLTTHLDEVRERIGVCPQFDILWDQLTPKETLIFYARLKGVPKEVLYEQVDLWLEEVKMTKYSNTLVKELNGGDRRKISVVTALIGQPTTIFLDEPTTGLDPESRRQVWDLLQKVKRGRCLILTTHSMEEADILCNRVGVLSRGRLLCIGPQNELKQKFGTGYRLFISFEPKNERLAGQFISSVFPNATIMESFSGYTVYRLPYKDARLSDVVQTMENNNVSAGVLEWGISPASLEDVFMNVVVPSQQMEFN